MDYRKALETADPIAAVIALAVVIAAASGGFAALGWDEATILTVASAAFFVAASIRSAVNAKAASDEAKGGVLR